jgi:hypothetical protein
MIYEKFFHYFIWLCTHQLAAADHQGGYGRNAQMFRALPIRVHGFSVPPCFKYSPRLIPGQTERFHDFKQNLDLGNIAPRPK